MVATTDIRAAARAASSAEALMPTGKPSAAPTPHTAAPRKASQGAPRMTIPAPTAARAKLPRSTGTRP